MERPQRHAFFHDGEERAVEGMHARWYGPKGIRELNERLRAPPVALRLHAIGKYLPAAKRARLAPEAVKLTREVMARLYGETKSLVALQMLNYPLPEFDPERFASPTGRAASERYLHVLREHERDFRPRVVPTALAVPPIVVFGTSRSAESLRMHALFGRTISIGSLENQRGNAHADYCLDVAAIGAGTALALLGYWWGGKDAGDEPEIQEAYDTLYHECLHRVCDLANPFGPQYGPKGGEKEHYWMTEYEPFASDVEDVLIDHLAGEGERGLLRRRLTRKTRS